MDNQLYAYSPIIERPRLALPNDARVAFWVGLRRGGETVVDEVRRVKIPEQYRETFDFYVRKGSVMSWRLDRPWSIWNGCRDASP